MGFKPKNTEETVLSFFRRKINSKLEKNERFMKRSNLINEFYENWGLENKYRQFDSIVSQLIALGYIKVWERGIYKILKPIPEKLNSGMLRKEYDELFAPKPIIISHNGNIDNEKTIIFKNILNILEEKCNVCVEGIEITSTISEYVDSLDKTTLALELEREYDIQIKDRWIKEWFFMSDIVEKIYNLTRP